MQLLSERRFSSDDVPAHVDFDMDARTRNGWIGKTRRSPTGISISLICARSPIRAGNRRRRQVPPYREVATARLDNCSLDRLENSSDHDGPSPGCRTAQLGARRYQQLLSPRRRARNRSLSQVAATPDRSTKRKAIEKARRLDAPMPTTSASPARRRSSACETASRRRSYVDFLTSW